MARLAIITALYVGLTWSIAGMFASAGNACRNRRPWHVAIATWLWLSSVVGAVALASLFLSAVGADVPSLFSEVADVLYRP
jgi:hypothetical protein